MVTPALKRSRRWQALFKRLVAPRGPVAPRQERLHPHPDRHPDVERATRDSQPIDMPNGSRVRIVGGLHPAGRRMSRPSRVVARCGALVKSRFFGSPARVSVWFACARAPQPTRSFERARAPQPPRPWWAAGACPSTRCRMAWVGVRTLGSAWRKAAGARWCAGGRCAAPPRLGAFGADCGNGHCKRVISHVSWLIFRRSFAGVSNCSPSSRTV
jgi:hypothetical protein